MSAAPLCPLCGEGAVRLLAERGDTDGRTTQVYQVWECAPCRVAFTWPRLTDAQLAPFYDDFYYARPRGRGFAARLAAFAEGRLVAARLRALERHAHGGRLLDVGCGAGGFVRAALAAGWDAEGLESSPAAATPGLEGRVRRGSLADLASPSARYDAITFWHSFEHLGAPREHLRRARRLLAPRGALLLAVPWYGAWEAADLRRWFHLDVPRHQFHYSPEGLARLLEAEGFRPLETTFRAFEHNAAGLLVTIQNRLGAPMNWFYDAAKRGRVYHPPRGPLEAVWTALVVGGTLSLGAPPILALNAWLERAGRAGTFILVAERGD